MRSGNGLAIILIGFGGLIILGKLGFGLGFLFGLIIPILVVLLGVMAWNNVSRMLGGIIGVIGGIMLLGQLSHLFVWVAAIALIMFGVSMLRRNPRV
ncbi:LiaF transmembrane domain-containing protein [Cohnella yongneupensis]|uniref:LiaF transmembrane domain-containing protein n=1 Tax=Cohnella yongneupensis TaxID=425006 RepID=A0ABW0QYK0_9BACL